MRTRSPISPKSGVGLEGVRATSADNYVLEISDVVPADHVARQLILLLSLWARLGWRSFLASVAA